jgi:hypothetical protein
MLTLTVYGYTPSLFGDLEVAQSFLTDQLGKCHAAGIVEVKSYILFKCGSNTFNVNEPLIELRTMMVFINLRT